MNIASNLKQARDARGYTQAALAEEIGVSRGVISNIEYGKTKPQPLVLHAVCKTLQINENWLLYGEGQMETTSNSEKSTQPLSEIYNAAKELSFKEQDYILDMIKTFQRHRETIAGTQNE